MRCIVLLGLGALVLISGIVACGEDKDEVRSGAHGFVAADLALDLVYERMEEALGDDAVLHVSVVPEAASSSLDGTPISMPVSFEDIDPDDFSHQLWIDAGAGVARVEIPNQDPSELRSTRSIHRTGAVFEVDEQGRSRPDAGARQLTCRGSDSWILAQLMRCGNWLEESTTVVESGEYDGRQAIALVTTGELPSHDWTSQFENRLYIDASSYLPLAFEHHSVTGGDSGGLDSTALYRYDIEFVSRGALADDFFDPASIGYVHQSATPSENLRPKVGDMVVYWLGEEFDAGRKQPVTLNRVVLIADVTAPGADASVPFASLSYGDESETDGYRGFSIRQFPTDAKDALESEIDQYWSGEGVTHSEEEVNGTRVVLYRNAGRYGDLYRAEVYRDTAMVVIGDHLGPPPYTGRDSIMRAVSQLRPYDDSERAP